MLWFPNKFNTLTTRRSPTVALISGKGHWPLMPMTGRANMPSGLAVTHVILKSYVMVAAWICMPKHRRKTMVKENMVNRMRTFSSQGRFKSPARPLVPSVSQRHLQRPTREPIWHCSDGCLVIWRSDKMTNLI